MAKKKEANGANGAGRMPSRGEAVERRRYKESLPVQISDSEAAKKGAELAAICRQREEFREERAEENRAAREKINFFNERITELVESVEKHTEMRDVLVAERLVVETNQIEVVRLDTNQVVSTRVAEAADRQEALFEQGQKPKKKRAKKAAADEGEVSAS